MHRIFVLSFHGIDRALESCESFSVIVATSRSRTQKTVSVSGKRYRVSRSYLVHSKETKVKICEDEPLNEIADTSRKWK